MSPQKPKERVASLQRFQTMQKILLLGLAACGCILLETSCTGVDNSAPHAQKKTKHYPIRAY